MSKRVTRKENNKIVPLPITNHLLRQKKLQSVGKRLVKGFTRKDFSLSPMTKKSTSDPRNQQFSKSMTRYKYRKHTQKKFSPRDLYRTVKTPTIENSQN